MPIAVHPGSLDSPASEAGSATSTSAEEDADPESGRGRNGAAAFLHLAATPSLLAADPPPAQASPCQSCGACCISFRVDFSVYELDDMGGTVPVALATEINGAKCRMRGTDRFPLRCEALAGTVGEAVSCTIYELRPRPCRELEAGSYGCERARARHGLASLAPVTSLVSLASLVSVAAAPPGGEPAEDRADTDQPCPLPE